MTVAVVTDSTAGRLSTVGIEVVPLMLLCDGEQFVDGRDLPDPALIERLRRGDHFTTSSPNPAAFRAAYAAAAARGASAIVSVHLSAGLSRTFETAVVAARGSEIPVHVVDSALAGYGLQHGVELAQRLAASGADAPTIVSELERRFAATRVWFGVDSLEHLRRGGRLGLAETMIASVMHIRPLLTLRSGGVVLAERIRTTERLDARLVELATALPDPAALQFAVQHVDAAERADRLAAALQQRGLSVVTAPAGGVLAVHIGPGAVALTATPN